VSSASHRGHAETDREGIEVGRRVRLPRGAQPPIRVFINGVEQVPDEDYTLDGRGILFTEPIVKEGKLGGLRWLMMYIGLAGSYRKHETIDVEYRLGDKTHLASDLAVEED
jgi:hypothetical protein